MKELDKNSPIPLYYQLYTGFLKDIREGTLKPGDMIPPETTLMEEYDVSRATVRHALTDLAREGYVIRAKSKGTIVNDGASSVGYRSRVKGFAALSWGNDILELKSKVLECRVVDPPKDVQEALKLRDGERVFYLKRVRGLPYKPNVYVEDWVPYKCCEGIEQVDFTQNSLYETLETRYGLSPYRAQRMFECCHAENEEQLMELKIRKSTSLLRCTSFVYDHNDQPLEYYVAIVNGKYTVNE